MDETKEATNRAPTFEDLKPMLRPTGIVSGVMKVDPEKCDELRSVYARIVCSDAGSLDEDKIPQMKEGTLSAFPASNCMMACPKDAISIVQPFEVKDAFFDTEFPAIKMPLEPIDADGNSSQWNVVERTILERRSVRNFKKDPVPDPFIRRVLEAARFAPSGGELISHGDLPLLPTRSLPAKSRKPAMRSGQGCIRRSKTMVR